jgi:sugar lactone lactonase YvrE
MLTPTSVSCSWAVATAVTVSWTNPPANAGGTTQALSATTSGGATSVAATSAVDATTVQVTPAAPLTTVRYLSTKAVRGTWSSSTSAEMPTNFCIGAVRLTAGTGTVGFSGDGGAATAAALNTPYQTAQAADGRIFIADSANNRIRVITTGGTISTFAGGVTASACTYSGPVSGLGLNAPRGVAVDTSGNVYIADTGAACIRKVDTTGTVTRFAGGGATTTCTAGAVGPTTLSLSSPSGLAVDSTGALIVADTGRNCVRKMTAATATAVAGGGATTTCGSTTSTGVSLSAPIGVAVDSANNIYIADTGRSCVRKVVGTSVTAVAGGGATTTCGTTTSTAVSLSAPQGVAVAADGSVLIADTGRRCIRRATGTAISLVAFTGTNTSTGDNGPALGATVQTPSSVAVLANGDLLVADRAITAGASDVRRIDLS